MKMALALLATATGSHPASWLHPSTAPSGSNNVDHYRALAQTAERGKFDLFFIADTPAARTEKLDAYARFPMFMNVFEPVTILSALAGSTSRIGLGGTVSTSSASRTTWRGNSPRWIISRTDAPAGTW